MWGIRSFLSEMTISKTAKGLESFLANNVIKEALICFSSMNGKTTAMQRDCNIVKFCLFAKFYVYVCSDGLAVQSSDVHELCSSQEEADTRIILQLSSCV